MAKGYIRARFYRDKDAALREAKRLRATGNYDARVHATNITNQLRWTLWTKRH